MPEVDRSMSEIDRSALALDPIAVAGGGLGVSMKPCLGRFHPPSRRIVGRPTRGESQSAEGKSRLPVLGRSVRCLPVAAESQTRSIGSTQPTGNKRENDVSDLR